MKPTRVTSLEWLQALVMLALSAVILVLIIPLAVTALAARRITRSLVK